MNNLILICLAAFTLGSALAAATFTKLIHAALAFACAVTGVAAAFFLLGAEFVGLVQIFVYVGAVAILIVFTILLTRRETDKDRTFNWSGVFVASLVFCGLVWTISKSGFDRTAAAPAAVELTVQRIGQVLMASYVWPLLGVGLLLTVALLGALILAMEERE